MLSKEPHVKLFIPGPVEVLPEVLDQMSRPQIGHRSAAFMDVYKELVAKLGKLLYTDNRIWLSTSSATGVWEAAVRNCVKKKALACVCGAFSKKWGQVVELNGKEVEVYGVPMGEPNLPEEIDKRLATGEFDAMTIVHNETSSGVMNPMAEIAEVMKKYPDVTFLVDAVSSMSGAKIPVDEWGIDICMASVQKAFALPAGFALFSVSDKAFEKSKTIENRGYYFDFAAFDKYAQKNQTISTPPIPHILALNYQMDRIMEEGIENRFARHEANMKLVHEWAKGAGFELFPKEGYESRTVTCITNTKGISIAELNKWLMAEKSAMLSNGYGDLKEKAFRIAHMGDIGKPDLEELFGWIDEYLASQ
jgi:aspartate aminotransferase-like enzyme